MFMVYLSWKIFPGDNMEVKERIEHLRSLIKYHSRRYYEDDTPEISDFEYDKMFE